MSASTLPINPRWAVDTVLLSPALVGRGFRVGTWGCDSVPVPMERGPEGPALCPLDPLSAQCQRMRGLSSDHSQGPKLLSRTRHRGRPDRPTRFVSACGPLCPACPQPGLSPACTPQGAQCGLCWTLCQPSRSRLGPKLRGQPQG